MTAEEQMVQSKLILDRLAALGAPADLKYCIQAYGVDVWRDCNRTYAYRVPFDAINKYVPLAAEFLRGVTAESNGYFEQWQNREAAKVLGLEAWVVPNADPYFGVDRSNPLVRFMPTKSTRMQRVRTWLGQALQRLGRSIEP